MRRIDKACTRCKETKPLSEFAGKNGETKLCASCRESARARAAKWYRSESAQRYKREYRRKAQVREKNAAYNKERRDRDPESAKEHTRQAVSKVQGKTLEGATNHGRKWTGPELEIALREDLSVAEAAALLGRTFYAVSTARHSARVDPRKIRLAGIGGDRATQGGVR